MDDQDRFAMPSVGLLSIASLARQHDEVTIFDEKVTLIPPNFSADVVAISFKTMDSYRAYSLADSLRAKNIKVILGGIHASLIPEEATLHADVVVVGEAEGIWQSILNDIKFKTHKQIYYAPKKHVSLHDLPEQRVELLNHFK